LSSEQRGAGRDAVAAVAAPHAAEARLRPRGSNQGGLRQFNERVVLQAIRLHGASPKAEIARLTHLTPQTVQLIIGRLEADDLVRKLAPLRGKVGQPSVPMALNPDGAFSIGVVIGRRRMDMLLIDFVGQVRERLSLDYSFPDPQTLFDDIATRLRQLRRGLKPALRPRLQGIGVAAPLSIGGWRELLDLEPEIAQRWARVDLHERAAALGDAVGLPVEVVKDTAAACVAELVAGRGHSLRSFLYIFVDTFIGGGLVLDSHRFEGVHGNAGAIGSLPLGLTRGADRQPAQLLSVASLFRLEALYAAGGLATDAWHDARAFTKRWQPLTESWLAESGDAIALAINSAACLLDIDAVIVDGSFSREMLAALLEGTAPALDRYSWEGVSRPQVLAGTVGSDARAIGGAMLPLHAAFVPDRELFLKADKGR
jgi:predicted NBD/HSP70 family sugar kinase